MINWFVSGVIVGIIFISYLLASVIGIGYLLDSIFGIHKIEQAVFIKLYKKHFRHHVINMNLGYNKIQDEEFYNVLTNAIETMYQNLSLSERDFEQQRLQGKLEAILSYTHKGFWTLTIIIGTITILSFSLTFASVLHEFISWAIKVILILYIAWIVEVVINERRITKQSIQITFYKMCLCILNRIKEK